MRHASGFSSAVRQDRTAVTVRRLVAAGGVVLASACAAPGLPPAGPAPGEIDVGYGARPGPAVTGSLTSISEKKVNASGALTLVDLLRGRVPGLQVTETASGVTYRLRGTSSFLADESPLFVVDGVPTSQEHLPTALAGVMMEDVRQVDVLKDVASTSIFGSRGAGGVIIITTRR